jgi:predicted nucleic acid-binding protein
MTKKNEAVLIDTSVWIAAFRGKPIDITETTRQLLKDDRVLTCGPVLFEIYRGLHGAEHKRIMPLMEALSRLPIDDRDWDLAGKMDASLRAQDINIPPMDVLIAQICLSHNVPIFTLDKHFESIEDLVIFSA